MNGKRPCHLDTLCIVGVLVQAIRRKMMRFPFLNDGETLRKHKDVSCKAVSVKTTALVLALAATLTLPMQAFGDDLSSWKNRAESLITTETRLNDECTNAVEVHDDSSIGAYCTMSAQQNGRIATLFLNHPAMERVSASAWLSLWSTYRYLMAHDLVMARGKVAIQPSRGACASHVGTRDLQRSRQSWQFRPQERDRACEAGHPLV